jgi:putative transposase
VLLTEEAYTSKASFPDRYPLPRYGEEGAFSGKRVHRGLYRSKKGFIHADVFIFIGKPRTAALLPQSGNCL